LPLLFPFTGAPMQAYRSKSRLGVRSALQPRAGTIPPPRLCGQVCCFNVIEGQ
jgi:hypothetical protein